MSDAAHEKWVLLTSSRGPIAAIAREYCPCCACLTLGGAEGICLDCALKCAGERSCLRPQDSASTLLKARLEDYAQQVAEADLERLRAEAASASASGAAASEPAPASEPEPG